MHVRVQRARAGDVGTRGTRRARHAAASGATRLPVSSLHTTCYCAGDVGMIDLKLDAGSWLMRKAKGKVL